MNRELLLAKGRRTGLKKSRKIKAAFGKRILCKIWILKILKNLMAVKTTLNFKNSLKHLGIYYLTNYDFLKPSFFSNFAPQIHHL
jgi:hypothetical protein